MKISQVFGLYLLFLQILFLIFTWDCAKMPRNKLRKEETTGNRRLPEGICAYKVKSDSSQLVRSDFIKPGG